MRERSLSVNSKCEIVLIVDADLHSARLLTAELALRGMAALVAADAASVAALLRSAPIRHALVDLTVLRGAGLAIISSLRRQQTPLHVVVTSAALDIPTAVQAMNAGAHDVIEKATCTAYLEARVRKTADGPAIEPSSFAPPSATSAILGHAPAVRAVREQIRTVARYRDLPVLISGETGTGKELVAQAVHAASGAAGAFVPLHCAAIAEPLFESELFGHEAGDLPSARGKAGLLEAAEDGTLFLDEVGELPRTLQPKLLRALETRSFRRVGSRRDIPFRARLVSTTRRTLSSSDSLLRNDLCGRLAGFTIATPPLRERSADLDMLARHFLADFAKRYTVAVEFSPRALEALHAYDWPGNVRELRAVVQQAALRSQGGRVGVADLTSALRDRKQTASLQPKQSGVYAAEHRGT